MSLYYFFCFLFATYRNSSFPASGSFINLTYDSLRGNSGMVDIATGIFNVQVSGDYEFHYQGRDVSVFPFFSDLSFFIMVHLPYSAGSNKHGFFSVKFYSCSKIIMVNLVKCGCWKMELLWAKAFKEPYLLTVKEAPLKQYLELQF